MKKFVWLLFCVGSLSGAAFAQKIPEDKIVRKAPISEKEWQELKKKLPKGANRDDYERIEFYRETIWGIDDLQFKSDKELSLMAEDMRCRSTVNAFYVLQKKYPKSDFVEHLDSAYFKAKNSKKTFNKREENTGSDDSKAPTH